MNMALEPLGAIGNLGTLGRMPALNPQVESGQPTAGTFANMLNGLLDGQRTANTNANEAITQLATGEAQDLHSVSLAVAQAELSFRMILEMRNRLTEAYQEVMRMQV